MRIAWVEVHLLSAGKCEEEERNGPDKFPYHSDGMPTGCGRKCTEEPPHRPIDGSGGRRIGIHSDWRWLMGNRGRGREEDGEE